MSSNPAYLVPAIILQIAVMVLIIFFLIAAVDGWRALSQRFRTDRFFPANGFTSSGSFRHIFSYNNVLRMAADTGGLYLACWFRIGHPPLFIPWSEIEIRPQRRFLVLVQTLVLGSEERIPLTLREKDVRLLLFMAGKITSATTQTSLG